MVRAASWRPDHALPGDEHAQVIEVGAVLDHAHGHQLAQHAAGGLQESRRLGLDQEHVVLVQDEVVARHQVAVLLADGGDHDACGQPGRQLGEGVAREFGVADGDLGEGQALKAGRLDLRAQQELEDVHAQDRADHADRVGHAVADGRVLGARDLDRGLSAAVLVMAPAKRPVT